MNEKKNTVHLFTQSTPAVLVQLEILQAHLTLERTDQRGGNVKCSPERFLDFCVTTSSLFILSSDAFWKNLVCEDYKIWREDNKKLSHFIKG